MKTTKYVAMQSYRAKRSGCLDATAYESLCIANAHAPLSRCRAADGTFAGNWVAKMPRLLLRWAADRGRRLARRQRAVVLGHWRAAYTGAVGATHGRVAAIARIIVAQAVSRAQTSCDATARCNSQGRP